MTNGEWRMTRCFMRRLRYSWQRRHTTAVSEPLRENLHLPRKIAPERMQLRERRIDVPDDEFVAVHLQVREAVGGGRVEFALGFHDPREPRAATAGDDEGGRDAVEFQVLQIVIVPAEIRGDAILLE